MFNGVFTAIVTPFCGGKLDISAFKSIVEWQKNSGISGVVVAGTTGESPNISFEEKKELVESIAEFRDESFKVILGTGSNNTYHAAEETKKAENLPIDAVLIVTPYYNKPTQSGLFEHFKYIHENSNIPIILYNVPSRTASSLKLETIQALSELPRVIGIKEATGDTLFAAKIKSKISKLALLSGDDGSFLPFLAAGGEGVISVVSNVAPKLMCDIYNYAKNGDYNSALVKYQEMLDLNDALFLETNPIPVKTALFEMGKLTEEFRLPLTPMGEINRRMLRMVLKSMRLM
ncbi:4-hydroxy-tetrahydrodipicolinate synthase [bacterium]|nr:4-hydroxy-tetrahydrodipicolinate synthase [bacterium]